MESRDAGPSSYLIANLALLAGFLSVVFVAVRLLSVTGFDPETAYAVLQAQGTGSVIVGSLVPIAGLILFPVGFVLTFISYTSILKKNDYLENPEIYISRGTGWLLLIIGLATAPIVILAVSVLVSFVVSLVIAIGRSRFSVHRQDTPAKAAGAEPAEAAGAEPAEAAGAESFKKIIRSNQMAWGMVVLYALAVMLSGAIISKLWVPAQNISIKSETFNGYVLSQDSGGEFVILTYDPIMITQMSSQAVPSMTFAVCRPSHYDRDQATLAQLVFNLISNSKRTDYPACVRRTTPPLLTNAG